MWGNLIKAAAVLFLSWMGTRIADPTVSAFPPTEMTVTGRRRRRRSRQGISSTEMLKIMALSQSLGRAGQNSVPMLLLMAGRGRL